MSLVPDNILNDLNKHKRDKSELLEYYIQRRLNKSLSNYIYDMQNTKERIDKKYKYKKIIKSMEGEN